MAIQPSLFSACQPHANQQIWYPRYRSAIGYTVRKKVRYKNKAYFSFIYLSPPPPSPAESRSSIFSTHIWSGTVQCLSLVGNGITPSFELLPIDRLLEIVRFH